MVWSRQQDYQQTLSENGFIIIIIIIIIIIVWFGLGPKDYQQTLSENGGMGVECQMFLRHLAEELSKKDGEPYAAVITWLRTRLSFEILRSVHLCVSSSRKPFRSANEVVNDFRLSVNAAEVFLNLFRANVFCFFLAVFSL